ncbi:two-component sensor histidine kinase [Rhodoblastus acidophilus]|uniref:sensor histidine kinase n=1 Tax=Rhodoblastus acidophilus TaxID=1074 RepID=UPI0022252277|nr:HWE histidine kinase domain-containing protein [Rhodoblastus acidophilus]MCW2286287.1 two-component sensor histidine kinase [Rhodoblastus acidophilus]MCW2335133.1 two-component sensor histidine kinase [Rhodoblastus acidophilus]
MNLEDIYHLMRSSHVMAQGIVDSIDAPLVVLDSAFVVVSANRAFYRHFKVDRRETCGRTLMELGDGQWDLPALRDLLQDVMPKSQAILGYEVTHDFPGLGVRTMTVSARRLTHPDDTSANMLVVFEDVTDARDAALKADVLAAESRHRVKNLLTVVQAVVSHTRTADRSAEEYKQILLGRVAALGEAQELSLSDGVQATLEHLVGKAALMVEDRVVLTPGPSVILADHQVLPFNMIIHEMFTNSLKYGALSQEGGRVRIRWDAEQEDADVERVAVRLLWTEEGGPSPKPTSTQGFGTRLIHLSAAQLGGASEHTIGPEGCRLLLTFAALNKPDEPSSPDGSQP